MGVLFPFKGYDFTISTFAEPKNCQTLGNVYNRYASRKENYNLFLDKDT